MEFVAELKGHNAIRVAGLHRVTASRLVHVAGTLRARIGASLGDRSRTVAREAGA